MPWNLLDLLAMSGVKGKSWMCWWSCLEALVSFSCSQFFFPTGLQVFWSKLRQLYRPPYGLPCHRKLSGLSKDMPCLQHIHFKDWLIAPQAAKSALSNHKRETLWLFPGHKAWPSWLGLIIHTPDTWAGSSKTQLPYKTAETENVYHTIQAAVVTTLPGLCCTANETIRVENSLIFIEFTYLL